MKKKLLIILVIMFAVLIKIDNVSAAENCNCYYTGYLYTKDNGSDYQTNYLVNIRFNKSDFDEVENKEEYEPKIAFFGEKGFNTVTGESGRINDKTSEARWFDFKFIGVFDDGKPKAGLGGNKVNALFENNCSCGSLGSLSFYSQGNSKDLYYNMDDHYHDVADIPLIGPPLREYIFTHEETELISITKEEFDEQRNSENVAETAEEQGYSATVDVQTIVDWANENGYANGDITSIGDPCYAISGTLQDMLITGFWIICVVGIILLVVMTAIGFIKAIVGSDEEKLKDAFKHLVTRIIVVIILLLLPTILTFVIRLVNENSSGEVSIGADGEIFCDLNK